MSIGLCEVIVIVLLITCIVLGVICSDLIDKSKK